MSRPPVTVPSHETALLPAPKPAPKPAPPAPRSFAWERVQRGFAGGVVGLFGAFCLAWPITDHLGVALFLAGFIALGFGGWMASWHVDARDLS